MFCGEIFWDLADILFSNFNLLVLASVDDFCLNLLLLYLWDGDLIRPSTFIGWHPTVKKSSSFHSLIIFIHLHACELMDSCSIPWALICYYRFILGSDCCIYGRWEPFQSGGFCVLWAGPLRCGVCCALWLHVLQARLCSPWSSFELAASARGSAWFQ